MSAFSPSALAAFIEPGVVVLRTLSDPAATGAAQFGWVGIDIADTDGDGARDVVTSAPNLRANNLFGAGRVYVYSGRTGALRFTLSGTTAQDHLGFSLADAGDVNGDGVHDILAGAPRNAGLAGYARVFSGVDGSVIRTVNGQVGQFFGNAVASPGDVDKDGFSDFAVGASGSASTPGSVFLYSGATGNLIRSWTGEVNGDNFGLGVGAAGDINRDGIGDLIIGAKDAGPARRGRAYVYSSADGSRLLPFLEGNPTTGLEFGWFFVATPGDVNADGVPDLYVSDFADLALSNNPPSGRAYVWSGVDGSLLHDLRGDAGDGAGPGRGAGDVDFDGHADLIVGSYTNSLGGNQAGRVRVYSGATGQVLRIITSNVAGEQFGFDAVGIGDVNGDCAPDFFVTAAGGNRAYIIAGLPAGPNADLNADHAVNTLDLVILLSRFGNLGAAGEPADINGDGVVDVRDLLSLLARFGQTCTKPA